MVQVQVGSDSLLIEFTQVIQVVSSEHLKQGAVQFTQTDPS